MIDYGEDSDNDTIDYGDGGASAHASKRPKIVSLHLAYLSEILLIYFKGLSATNLELGEVQEIIEIWFDSEDELAQVKEKFAKLKENFAKLEKKCALLEDELALLKKEPTELKKFDV
jgi:hypothetical protein